MSSHIISTPCPHIRTHSDLAVECAPPAELVLRVRLEEAYRQPLDHAAPHYRTDGFGAPRHGYFGDLIEIDDVVVLDAVILGQ